MRKSMQRKGGKKRDIVGKGAAVVLIAFVVIAAALAHVVTWVLIRPKKLNQP